MDTVKRERRGEGKIKRQKLLYRLEPPSRAPPLDPLTRGLAVMRLPE